MNIVTRHLGSTTSHLITTFLPIFYFLFHISDALVCLSCSSVPHPHSCTTVSTSNPSNTYCFVALGATSGGVLYYTVGYKDKLFCHSNHRRSESPGNITLPYHRNERGTTVCQECCDTDLCNAAGCTAQGYSSPRGPICYACSQQKSPSACNQIQVCGRDEHCYIERHQYGTDILYTSACMTQTMCGALGITKTTHTQHAVPIIGRNADEFFDPTRTNVTVGKTQHHRSEADTFSLHQRSAPTQSRACCTTDLCNHNDSLLSVNRGWSAWSSWTTCSTTCDAGQMTRTRTCSNPAPGNGGSNCTGDSAQTHYCKLTDCPASKTNSSYTCLSCSGAASPRDCNFVQQCGPNSVCYLEKHLTTGNYFTFYSGCRDRQFCKSSRLKRQEDFTHYLNYSNATDEVEDTINNDKKICTECCEGDLCNSRGCGESGYPLNQGPVCYKCDQQSHPAHCNEITLCKADEACHLTHRQIVGIVYSTGCIKRADCAAHGYLNTIPVSGFVGRRDANMFNSSRDPVDESDTTSYRERRTVTPCSKCCTTNLCNSDTCQTVIPHTTQITAISTASTKAQSAHFTTAPPQPSVQKTSTSTTTITTTKPSTTHVHNGGHGHVVNTCPVWGAWTPWSSCNEVRAQLTGYTERQRICNDGNFEMDKKYCGQYVTQACVPATIVSIEITMGSWKTGGSVNIQCNVDGKPTPTIKWSCTNNCEALDMLEYDNSMFAAKLDSKYSGTYTCIADNGCGHAVKDYVATVT